MATMNDIAKLAGVSRGTVSNVLNKHGVVSYDKIKLVEEAAAKLGYNLDKNAKTLRSGTSNVLALILPTISSRRYADLYMGILNEAGKQGFEVRLYLTSDFPYEELKAIDNALNERAYGILTVSCLDDVSHYQPCTASQIPVIFLERPVSSDQFPSFSLSLDDIFTNLKTQKNPEKITIITENIRFQNQYTFMKELKKTFKFSTLSFYEYNRDESEAIYDAVKESKKEAVYITSNEEIALRLENIYVSFFQKKPVIYTLSSLRPEKNLNFTDFPLNYRLLGRLAAAALIKDRQSGTKTESLILQTQPTVSCSPPAVQIPHASTRLRMLAHKTPVTNALQKLIPEFTAQTGIEVELVNVSLNESLNEMKKPEQKWDVIRVDPSTLYCVAPSILTNLETIDPQCKEYFSNFLPNLPEDYSRSNGAVYAFPFDISMQLLFYRKSWFDSIREQRAYFEATGKALSVPQTFEEYDRVIRFFTRSFREDSPSAYGSCGIISNATSVAGLFMPRMMAADASIYTSSNKLNLMSDSVIRTLSDYAELVRCSDPMVNSGWSDVAEHFVNGLYATAVLFSNHASLLIRTNSMDLHGEIGFAPMPSGNSLLAGGSLGVGKYSENKKAAYHFIRWAAGPAIAPRLVQLGGTSACNQVYLQEELLDTYPWLRFIKEHISSAVRKPTMFHGSYTYNQRDFEHVFGSNILSVIHGTKTAKQALADTQNYIDSLIK